MVVFGMTMTAASFTLILLELLLGPAYVFRRVVGRRSRNCYMFILYYTNVNGLFTIGDDVSVVYKSIGEEQHPMTSTIIQQR